MNSFEQDAMKQQAAIARIPVTGSQGLGESVDDYLNNKMIHHKNTQGQVGGAATADEYLNQRMNHQR